MRGCPGDHDVTSPDGLAVALKLLHDEPGVWRPLAGGTDVLVQFEAGDLAPSRFLGLWRYPELGAIKVFPDRVEIGALATYTDVRRHPVVVAEFPNLVRAAQVTGGVAIQNRGTIGGNIANASPAADSPPALMGYDAEVELLSAHGARRMPLADFNLGYKKTAIAADEIISAVHIKREAGRIHFYRKVGTREAQAIAKVVMALTVKKDGRKLRDVRLAVGSVAPVTCRCRQVEQLLEGGAVDHAVIQAARTALLADISPIDDIRSTKDFRVAVAQNVLSTFLQTLV